MADSQFVYIRMKDHASDVPPGRVTRQAYDTIWSGKGFVIVDNDEAELLGSPATVMEMNAGTSAPASEAEGEAVTTTRKRG